MKNPLSQYIELYEAEGSLIDAGGAPALNAWRDRAAETLRAVKLPAKGSENYEQTDLPALLAPDYGLNLGRRSLDINPAETFSCRVPNLSTALFFLRGDSFGATANSCNQLPEGITVCSLRHAALTQPELVERYYGRLAPLDNPLVALNTMLAQDGLFIHVAAGVKVEKPLQLVAILGDKIPMMAVRRLLIVLEPGAEACLLCCDHTQGEQTPCLNLQTTEIFCGHDSRFDIYELEESSRLTTRLGSLYASLDERANLLVDGITLFNGVTRNETYVTLRGRGAELRLLGMGIEDEDRRLDNYTLIRHETGGCTSHELFKYVVDDRSVGAFTGRIYVAPDAQKTEAYQANRNLVASPDARMFSKPQLEIYADDVKCSHGTAIGQLDPMQIFYMRTRGLSESTAKTLLRQAFMADVIEPVRLGVLRDRLRHLVDMRLAGDSPASDCAACASLNCDDYAEA
ncbi:MAG: SufD family Fe-S cluster assembly protein [Muribaculaceae bacterium]|nr:SufD family Fe-S cluster assembly protein [Muribaculaceae bacterium]